MMIRRSNRQTGNGAWKLDLKRYSSSLCGNIFTFKRGEGVVLERTAQNGLLVRMIGDVKGSTTIKTSLTSGAEALDSPTPIYQDPPAASSCSGASYPFMRTGPDMSTGEAEQRLLRGAARGAGSYTRFMTLHRRRRRKPPTRLMERHNRALLDDLYNGPTQCVLSQVGVWGFNAFSLDSVCGGRPVSVLCVYLLHKYGLIEHFNFDTVTVWKCFSLIEDGYHASNPYHNAIHAADVTQAMHCYLQEEAIREHMTPLETLSALVAAVCHDLDHPGVNQPFLIATDNHLAALYENLSVLENHHWRCAMGCLWESGLLDSWAPEDVTALQEMIRSLILATDITRQQEFLRRFQNYLEGDSFDMQDPEHRHFSLQIALKCADICNPCRPSEISRQWSYKICDEFYRQGDYERQLNIPVTSMCDRRVTTVAKIQTGFIEHVVSPLFIAWDNWLSTSLSALMLHNMNKNLSDWKQVMVEEKQVKNVEQVTEQEQAKEEKQSEKEEEQEDGVAESSTGPPASPGLPREDDLEEVDGGTTPSSSGDSHQSVVGSLENVSRSLQLGRRHSVPLNMPRLIPRTIIRRESLPEDGSHPVVVETVEMGGMSITSLSSLPPNPNSPLTSDTLLPETSITAMSGLGNGRPHHHSRLKRRKSLPPLWSQQTRARTLQALQPLSPTPSEDSSPLQNTQENSAFDKELEKRTGFVSGSAHTSTCREGSKECEGGAGCSGGADDHDCHECLGKTHKSFVGDSGSSARECGVHGRKNNQLSYQGATFLHSDCSDSCNYRLVGSKVLVRRASLDSTSVNSKREFLDRLAYGSSKFARVDRSDGEVDKENLAPQELPTSRERQVHLCKTRAWRSLNCDEENIVDHREKIGKPGIYKLNHSQGSIYVHGRRGSAPVLRPEELLGGLRGGAERPDPHYLATRRGSAPSQPIHQGSDTDSGPEVPGSPRTPLTSTENLPQTDSFFSQLRLRRRRGSMPFDLPQPDTGFDPFILKQSIEKRFGRRGSGEADLLPSPAPPALCLASAPRPSLSLVGGGAGGGDVPLGMNQVDVHRVGSGGLELFGSWRSQLESGSVIFDDSELYCGSSGGMTPVTPGALPSVSIPLTPSLHRRGSLPTDLFYSGDISVWDSEGT